jgi:hypothetical protein
MSIATPISQLKQLDEIQKSTYTQSLANKLRKSAAQTNLQELYRPLLAGQKDQLAAQKDSTSELEKFSKLSSEQTNINEARDIEQRNRHEELKKLVLIVPLIKSIKHYPLLNQLLLGEDVDPRKLSSDEQAILRETNKLDQQTLQTRLRANRVIEKKLPAYAVADYDPELDDDFISEIDRSPAGEKTIPDSGIGEPAAEAAVEAVEPAAVDEADREQEIKYLNNVGRVVFNTLTGSQGVEQMTDPNLIREFLTSPVLKQGSPYAQYDNLTQKDLLIDYLVDNRIPTDGCKNPWKTINNNIDAHFIDKVRRRQGLAGRGLTGVAAPLSSYTGIKGGALATSYEAKPLRRCGKCIGNLKCPCFISNRNVNGGSIIQFLSSNPEELIKKLNTMLAEFQAGNTSGSYSIIDINDQVKLGVETYGDDGTAFTIDANNINGGSVVEISAARLPD